MGCHFLLQGIFPTQGSNPGLPHCRWILYQLSQQGSPIKTLNKDTETLTESCSPRVGSPVHSPPLASVSLLGGLPLAEAGSWGGWGDVRAPPPWRPSEPRAHSQERFLSPRHGPALLSQAVIPSLHSSCAGGKGRPLETIQNDGPAWPTPASSCCLRLARVSRCFSVWWLLHTLQRPARMAPPKKNLLPPEGYHQPLLPAPSLL